MTGKEEKKTVPFFLRLEKEDDKKLRKLAKLKGISPQALVKMQIKDLLFGFVDDSERWVQDQERS